MRILNISALVIATIVLMLIARLREGVGDLTKIATYEAAFHLLLAGSVAAPVLSVASIWIGTRKNSSILVGLRCSWMPLLASAVFAWSWVLL